MNFDKRNLDLNVDIENTDTVNTNIVNTVNCVDTINNEIPENFFEFLKQQYSKEEIFKIIQGYKAKRKPSIRVNTLKSNISKVKNELIANNIRFSEVPWSKNAFIIENSIESKIQELEIYKNGEIYMQSLSSMLPPIVLEPKQGEDILDMCSAPRRKNKPNCRYYSKFCQYNCM